MRKLLCAMLLLLFVGCGEKSETQKIHEDFEARLEQLPTDKAKKAVEMASTQELREALEFLYAYMSWPDVADYDPAFHVAQAECALKARQEMPWGKIVPDREWRHFVLPVRVNNEQLDSFRTVCYDELKERVQGLSMYDAVLEVNHWCHEYVTYKPSDSRTSTPLASMKTATGRCGEESTFTVAALRAVGIPARQVYTPRWAHTDDNHAWVEAWVDGTWYFLGACEPEPVLNLGWFNQPASRGMLMHTKVFGNYGGPEDQMSKTACFTEINVTRNYADVAKACVRVLNAAGQPAVGARVEFKLYNYAELYTVMTTEADKNGEASITAGLGDIVAWATDGIHYGFCKMTMGKDSLVDLKLDHQSGDKFTFEMNITPPKGKNNMPELTEQQIAENQRRFAYEDSIRNAYVQTFADSATTQQFCQQYGGDFKRLRPLVVKSCGNYANVFELYKTHKDLALDVLEVLSDKDLRDFNLDVLNDHLKYPGEWHMMKRVMEIGKMKPEGSDFYVKYVLNPRIVNEHLTPWRGYLRQVFTKEEQVGFRENPSRLADWIRENVVTDSIWNPVGLCLSPRSAFEYRFADVRSKGILFVAAARSIGIPARIDEVTAKVQFWNWNRQLWNDVSLGDSPQKNLGAGELVTFGYTPREFMEDPKYYYHFTLSRLFEGRPVLQEYPEGASWKNSFAEGQKMDKGDYLLTSGTRMADGSVLAHFTVFPVGTGGANNQHIIMREDKGNVQVIGSFNSENRYYDLSANGLKSILSTTGRGYFVVGLVKANHEPTNHILHDIEKQKDALEAWGREIILLFPSQNELDRFNRNRAEFTHLPKNLRFGVDSEGMVAKDLFNSGLAPTRELPVVIIGDTFNRVVFKTQGYTIGLGEQLIQTIGKL